MLPATDEIVLHRVSLRGTGSAVESARAPLRTALEHADWPSTPPGEMLFLRRISGSGTVRASAAHAAAQARFLARSAVDGWSAAAPDAQAVHFRSHASLLACLIRDLLCGNARRNWYWRRWQDVLRRPADEALVTLLLEEPLSLPTLISRLHPTPARQIFWQALDGSAGERLLSGVARAAGWQPAVQAARDILSRDAQHAAPLLPVRPSMTIPPAFDPAIPGINAGDPRALLAAMITLWQQSPALLHQPAGAAHLCHLAGMVSKKPPPMPDREQSPSTAMTFAAPENRREATPQTITAAPPHAPVTRGTRMADEPGKTSGAIMPARREATQRPAVIFGADGNMAAAMKETAAPVQEKAAHADAMPRIEADTALLREPGETEQSDAADSLPSSELYKHDFITRQGGLFYLINFLNLPAVQAQLFAADNIMASQPGAGWRCFYHLAAALGCPPEGELLVFLASECALDNVAALIQQPPPAQMDQLLRLGENRYGAEVWQAATWQLPARLIASASHLDLHFRLNDARLPVRRAGLDINPGWLPWLGRVVTFHYGSGLEPS